ncbi:MAG TPA: hypothetical protein VL976_02970 [Xanthobacteraceae bacterium]|jgi:hypothetical protein|nr:hypothetical protein [Xanthobacteraceae bacterium]
MHPVLALGLGVVGVVAIARWCAKEVRRVNSELDHLRARTVEPVDRDNLPKLKPDPKTGEYRPG